MSDPPPPPDDAPWPPPEASVGRIDAGAPPRHEPALTRDPRVLIALIVVLSGFLAGLALLLFLIATDV